MNNYYNKYQKYKNKYSLLKYKLSAGSTSINTSTETPLEVIPELTEQYYLARRYNDDDFVATLINLITLLQTHITNEIIITNPIILINDIDCSLIHKKYNAIQVECTLIQHDSQESKVYHITQQLSDNLTNTFKSYISQLNIVSCKYYKSIELNDINVQYIINYFCKNITTQLAGGIFRSVPTITIEQLKIPAEQLNAGTYGTLYVIRQNEMPLSGIQKIQKILVGSPTYDYVIKILKDVGTEQEMDTLLDEEIQLYNLFAGHGIGPRIVNKITPYLSSDINEYSGGYTMKKYTSDLMTLLLKYKLNDEQIVYIETRIEEILKKIIEIKHIPTDIKLQNILVDYIIKDNKVIEITELIFTDFDCDHYYNLEVLNKSHIYMSNTFLTSININIIFNYYRYLVILTLLLDNLSINFYKFIDYFKNKKYNITDVLHFNCIFKNWFKHNKIPTFKSQMFKENIYGIIILNMYKDLISYIYRFSYNINLIEKIKYYNDYENNNDIIDYCYYLLLPDDNYDDKYDNYKLEKIITDMEQIPNLINSIINPIWYEL